METKLTDDEILRKMSKLSENDIQQMNDYLHMLKDINVSSYGKTVMFILIDKKMIIIISTIKDMFPNINLNYNVFANYNLLAYSILQYIYNKNSVSRSIIFYLIKLGTDVHDKRVKELAILSRDLSLITKMNEMGVKFTKEDISRSVDCLEVMKYFIEELKFEFSKQDIFDSIHSGRINDIPYANFILKYISVHDEDKDGNTILNEIYNENVANHLIKLGADPYHRNKNNDIPHLASYLWCKKYPPKIENVS